MEVYNSVHTAAELEYALSAVPSIGENGNWYIGDQDTGVFAEGLTPYVGENGNWWVGETDTGTFAGGVDVTGLSVGQSIAAASVDEDGRPTSWTAYAPPTAQAEILLDTTLEEAVSYVMIDTDMNGNPFEVKAIFVRMLMPALGSDESGAALTTGYFYSTLDPYIRNTTGTDTMVDNAWITLGPNAVGTSASQTESWWSLEISSDSRVIYNYGFYRTNLYNAPNVLRKYGPNDGDINTAISNGKVTALGFRCQNISLPAGTVIRVYKIK